MHYQLAQVARATGKLDVALEQLDLASKVDRDNVHMLKLLGEVAREKGQLEDAERAYRTLLLLLGRSRRQDKSARHASTASARARSCSSCIASRASSANTSAPRTCSTRRSRQAPTTATRPNGSSKRCATRVTTICCCARSSSA